MKMRGAWSIFSVYYAVVLLLGGCHGMVPSGSIHERSSSAAVKRVRDRVLAGLAGVDILRGSVLQVVIQPLEAGMVVVLPTMQNSTFHIPVRGYLVFVDEKPKMDWAHTARIVVVPSAVDTPPVTLFRGSFLSDIRITTGSGEAVPVSWLKL